MVKCKVLRGNLVLDDKKYSKGDTVDLPAVVVERIQDGMIQVMKEKKK